MAVQRFCKPKVGGSIPSAGTTETLVFHGVSSLLATGRARRKRRRTAVAQAQNQAHLFGLGSLWRRFRCWIAGHRFRQIERRFTLSLRVRRAIALTVYAIGLLRDYLRAARDRRRLRALERICLEQARLCNLPEPRAHSRKLPVTTDEPRSPAGRLDGWRRPGSDTYGLRRLTSGYRPSRLRWLASRCPAVRPGLLKLCDFCRAAIW